jgi:Inositol 1,4,5-trisphosphate/ryanodine receptor
MKVELEENTEIMANHSGLAVAYGQGVILKHLYSGCYVTLNNSKLAKQIGTIRITLNEEDSVYSNLRFMPSSRIKKIGDLVNYSDSVLINNMQESYYFLHTAEFLVP